MKHFPITELQIGSTVRRNVYAVDGSLVFSEGTVIEKEHIDYLWLNEIDELYVEEESVPADESDYIEKERERAREGYRTVLACYEEALEQSKELHFSIVYDLVWNIPKIREKLRLLIAYVLQNNDVLRMLRILKKEEEYLYTHPVHVAMIGAMLAKWNGHGQEECQDVALCGFFHDVGKSKIDLSLMSKKTPICTEERAELQKHARLGHELLKEKLYGLEEEIQEEILEVALSHHEKMNGDGYPNGKKGDRLTEYTRIISIADVFDAITSNRQYKEASSPYHAYRLVEEETMKRGLDPILTHLFLKKISQYFVNNKVRLSDGRIAEVIYINNFSRYRPLVKVGDEFIDLSMNYALEISEVLL